MRAVDVVVPDGIDDPARPSGGNLYDRRLMDGLRATGWTVREHPVAGPWPWPDASAAAALAAALGRMADGATVLVDGLVASASADVLVPHAGRLRLAVLVHLPLGEGDPGEGRRREAAVLDAAAAVLTTSRSARARVLALHPLPPERVHVAEPGVDASPLAAGGDGGALLCVAAVIPGKGHDVLVDALAAVRDLPWACRCVGTVERDPAFAADVRLRAARRGLGGRVELAGPRTGAALDAAYAAADLLVLPSRGETYGMVVVEALARGVPVLASDVGGVPEALGHAADGTAPGLLVPPDDPDALAGALRAWLADESLRGRLRVAARDRRRALAPWTATAARVAAVLDGLAA